MPNDDSADARAVADLSAPSPGAEPDPKVLLDHIAEVSRNASATWFGLLGLLAFVGITLLGHRDADFFARGAGTQLPLVNITVPVEAFFLAAPALVAAVYAYFHLYLMSLWDALAEAPPRVDDQPLSDRVYPWLISYAALWYRDRRRRDGSSAARPLGRTVVAVAFLFGWLFGIVVLAGLWWRSMPAHDEWLTLWSGACLCFATLIGLTGFAIAAKRMAGASRLDTATNRGMSRPSATAFAALVILLSWETTEGTLLTWTKTGEPMLLVSADLREAELTPRPPDWKPFELWLRDLRRERGIGDPDQSPLIPTAEEIERYRLMIAGLGAPSLGERDLRKARLWSAFLPGADLREAKLQGALLNGAQMQGASFRFSEMQGARLDFARLQGADFHAAVLQDGGLGRTAMQGATLSNALLRRANLNYAQMQGADLTGALMQGADLRGAKMQGALLRAANLDGAELSGAQMQGASISGVEMQGAKLGRAQMQGADLRDVRMQNADCSGTAVSGAVLHFADVTCGGLNPEQLRLAVGDAETILPGGLAVSSCLDLQGLDGADLERIESALAHHPERTDVFYRLTRSEIRGLLFCDPLADDLFRRSPQKVGRHMEPAATAD